MSQAEAELEKFRKEWQDEVTAKSKAPAKSATAAKRHNSQRQPAPSGSQHRLPRASTTEDEGVSAFHDLEEQSAGRRLDDGNQAVRTDKRTPKTALEHYEHAVEKERLGNLGDSLNLYRKAFRLDDGVHEKYKNKHFPPSAFKSKAPTGTAKKGVDSSVSIPSSSTNAQTVPEPRHESTVQADPVIPQTIGELLQAFSQLSIPAEPPPTQFSPAPPCPIADLPEEVLVDIIQQVALSDVASLARLSVVCKRFAFLVMSEDSIWRRLTHGFEYGIGGMHYEFDCGLLGQPLDRTLDDLTKSKSDPTLAATNGKKQTLALSSVYPNYRAMFRIRPRVRFSGCYISTCNYTRPGASNASNFTWNSPILIVTYYRYLRFFRDGTCISLCTTSEPSDVVPWLRKEHAHRNHTGALPQAVMKDALKGRWRLSGDPYQPAGWKLPKTAGSDVEELEEEGDIIIETEGALPRYTYKMHLGFASSGRGGRNNKLAWKGYWSYNKLTDDWSEFGRKNDRAFYWSRVRSYGNAG